MKNINWKISILFFLLWFGILILTGTMFSGFHFIDDHDVLRIDKDISNTTIAREARIFFKDIFKSKLRFRPFYMLQRRITTALLGNNFFAWSLYFGFLAVFTSFFLYLFMRKIGFSVKESILFPCLTLLGEQAAVWWKLGANETPGMLMLSAAMLFMALSVYSNRKKNLYNFLFVLFTIIASWCKESFILMIPGLVFWKIWLTCQKGETGDGDRTTPMTLLRSVRKNLITAVILLLVCLVELAHIVTKVGTTGIQYAGYEGFNLSRFIQTGIRTSMTVHGWVIPVQLAVIIVMLYLQFKKNKTGFTSLYNLVWPVILTLLIVVPQIVLYMKSGMMERYLLPCVLGYAFLMVVLLKYTREKTGEKRIFSKSPAEIFVLLLLIGISLQQLRVTRYTAIAFAYEGKHTNAWFQSIKQNTHEPGLILVITDLKKYLEPSLSLKTYLDIKMNRRNTWFSPVTLKPGKSSFRKGLNKDFLPGNPVPLSKEPGTQNPFTAVLIFPLLEESFIKNHNAHWFNPAQYERYSNEAGFVSYYRK